MSESTESPTLDAGELGEWLRSLRSRFDELRGRL